ncbi:MAG: apolipoprotein N-acyltransferase [Bacteroidales bacterium]|jgi:apolipoprotein N-acyltransferase|nr:apolipoprotein N-acyltransferase [Bacteroidales bacterium]MDI9576366.1 apolipoprotein N-acyltransferase [Bacteroidota bacterium]MDD3755125.1 apolipoprotein N-acyltransferase [Bacteroidales bacterium]MDY0400641.1 apolipoprotein N-acyltransferase [Bacteroidales bacterium]HHW58617.1 apolipoprotein N-acyltransferase [Bacteroidales bacterium]
MVKQKNYTKIYLLLASITGGGLLSLSWPLRGFPLLSLISLVPFLWILDYIENHRTDFVGGAVFRYTYLGFLLWNAATSYWIWYATAVGSIFVILVNAALMSFSLQLAFNLKKWLGSKSKIGIIYIILWLCFEYLHFNWELSWPWLSLGNVFATMPAIVQWYEFTGILGGTLWIWLVNIFIYYIILSIYNKQLKERVFYIYLIILFFLLAIPLTYSLFRYNNINLKNSDEVNVLVLQPNLDPYKEEFTISPQENITRIKNLIDEINAEKVDFFLAPESNIQEGIWENNFDDSYSINEIKKILKEKYPNALYITGASTYKIFEDGESLTSTARYNKYHDFYFDAYNSVLFIDTSGVVGIYHKIKLVAGVEQMPYKKIIKPIEKLAINLGGTTGSLGKDSVPYVHPHYKANIGVAICYESVFGEFISDFVKRGANVLFVITNDGWWGNTAGHRQHFSYASLRAIETRREIARSANTGISCVINKRGDVLKSTNYWEKTAFLTTMSLWNDETIYTKHGDYIGRIAVFSLCLIILIDIIKLIIKKIH